MGLTSIESQSKSEGIKLKEIKSISPEVYDDKNLLMKAKVLDNFVYSTSVCDFFLESKGRDPTLTTNRVKSCRGKTYTAIALIIAANILIAGIIFALQSEFNQFLSADTITLFNYLSLILIIVGIVGVVFIYWLNRQYSAAVKETFKEFR